MLEEIIRLSLFVAIGMGLWALSLRWSMPAYGPQPIRTLDVVIVVIGFAIAGLYDLVVAPVVLGALAAIDPLVQSSRQYFAGTQVWVSLLCFIVAADFLGYWAHRLLHTRWLWQFHAFHHSPRSLTWLSGMRGSPVHFLLMLMPATVVGAFCLVTTGPLTLLTLLAFDVLSHHTNHTNLRIPFARQIEYAFVTPRMHFTHHHPDIRYTNANYGFIFTIWDHLFGTYVDPSSVDRPGELGLDYENTNWRLFLGLPPPAK